VKKLNIGSFCDNEITEKSNKYLKATKISETKRADTNAVFTGLMYLLDIVVLISTIIMASKGYDVLPLYNHYPYSTILNGYIIRLKIYGRQKWKLNKVKMN